ncbi:MAG: restriction endonuclease subunit S [Treponema sp.]|nr:restriction endonuclease subunit S [Treponema sp.]
MDTKLLKHKILDLAIHGKLVPQYPNDEPASKLLEKIREEKQKLIAEKKIKADKNDSYIFVGDDNRHYEKFADGTVKDIEDEIPFEVSEGWAWCRLGSYLDVRDGTHDSPKYVEKGYPFVTSKNLVDGKIDFSSVQYISEKDHNEFIKRSLVEDGDILFAMIGSIGNPVLVKKDREFSIKNVALFKPYSKENTFMEYVLYFLIFIQESLRVQAKGGMQPFIPLSFFRKDLLIPLPPVNQQKIIVAEIKKIFTQINSLETDKIALQTVIKQAKSKILDLAIHGKLVPQNPSDEPASLLLEKLREEKEAKIKAGELKRDKNDSYIYKNTTDNCYYQKFANGTETDISDEIPFNIPNNWNWCLGIEIFNPMKSRKPTGDTFRYIDIETIDNKKHKVVKPKVLSVSDAPSRASREVSTGDVLFSLVRPYLENIALINEENQDCIASTGFFICKPNEVINPNYLFFLMTSNYVVQGLNQFMKGDNSPSEKVNFRTV